MKFVFYIPYRISFESGVIGKSISEANVQDYVRPATRTGRQDAAGCIAYLRMYVA